MPTQVILKHRRFGVCTEVKEATIPMDVVSPGPQVDEEALLGALPADFWPGNLKAILLLVGDRVKGSTGVSRPVRFHRWTDYFDAYVVEVVPQQVATLRSSIADRARHETRDQPSSGRGP